MPKKNITLTLIFIYLVLAAGAFWYRSENRQNPDTTAPPRLTSADIARIEEIAKEQKRQREQQEKARYYTPTYAANGKINTSDWVVYRGDISGYSLRAPKSAAAGRDDIDGLGSTENPISMDIMRTKVANQFILFFDEEDAGGIFVFPIVKDSGSNLSNWLDRSVVNHPEKIYGERITTYGKYNGLEFNVKLPNDKKDRDSLVSLRLFYYPNFYDDNTQQERLELDSPRTTVVDAGDRYLVFSISTTSKSSYLDTYSAILSSLQVFEPKKP